MIPGILANAWGLYRRHFGVIAAVVVVIWLPLDLLISYMGYFVFDPDDLRMSFKLSRLLENFVGIIATAGVISVGYTSWSGQAPSFGSAIRVGARSWGRMWWTRFLSGLAVLVGFLLLIVPGIYLLVRLALIEPIAVCERVSGPTAMRRSFELTRGRFWQVFFLGLAFGALIVTAAICVVLPVVFIPALDHWIVDAITSLGIDVIAAFGTLCLLSAYTELSGQQEMACQPLEATADPSRSRGMGA